MTKEEAKTEVENALKFIYTREHTAEVLEALSAEPQDLADRERVIALRVNNKTCVQCKHYERFDKKEFPCIDCMLDCKDRFEPKPVEPQEWISVKKKGNPTRSDEYWVTVRHTTFESVERDYYSTTHGRWETLGEVIAWREVEPSPYKGE